MTNHSRLSAGYACYASRLSAIKNIIVIKKIVFIVPPKVQLLDLNGPIHVFYEAKEYGAPLDLHFASINQHPSVVSSCVELQFTNLVAYDEVELSSGDYVFVPGITFELLSDISFLAACSGFFKWLREQHSNNINILVGHK